MLTVHILNVGHGDCTIIKHHSGRLTVVDINNSQEFDNDTFNELVSDERKTLRRNPLYQGLGALSGGNALMPSSGLGMFGGRNALVSPVGLGALSFSEEYARVRAMAKAELTDPIAFLKTRYPNQQIWRFVLTHPDLDHMRGLKRLYESIGFTNFWDTHHTKEISEFRSEADKEDWIFYKSLRSEAQNVKPKYYTRGDAQFAFAKDESGASGGDNIDILSPTPALVASCNEAGKSNDVSLVLRVRHAGRSILLGGDAEVAAWDDMVQTYGVGLKSCFLKASHHGRDSGYHLEALKLIDPLMTFVSVGKKPDTDASNKYRQQTGRKVPSTRYYGNIEIQINDGGQFSWFVDRNAENS